MTDTATTEHVDPEPAGDRHGIGVKGHPTDAQYIVVALVLASITAIEVAVYYITAIPKHTLTVMLLVMSAVKFTAVVLWFMHLRFDSRMFRRLFVTGLVLAFSVMLIFMSTLHFYSPSRH